MSYEETQDAEAGYLRKLLLIERRTNDKNNLIITEDRLQQAGRYHICSKACGPFRSLNTKQKFIFRDKRYEATGYVFMCPLSGRIHLCGLHKCLNAVTQASCSTIVCELTGLDLGVGITLARTRQDRDVFLIGNDITTRYVLSKKSEGVTESQMLKKLENTVEKIQECFDLNMQIVFGTNNNDDRFNPFEDEENGDSDIEKERKKSRNLSSSSSSSSSASSSSFKPKNSDINSFVEDLDARESEIIQDIIDRGEYDKIGDDLVDPANIYSITESSNGKSSPRSKVTQAKKSTQRTPSASSNQMVSKNPISLYDTGSKTYQELFEIANRREEDVLDITSRFPSLDVEVIKQKLIKRVVLRQSASNVWNVYAVTQNHLDEIESRVKKRTSRWRKTVIEYYKECEFKGELPNKLHIMNLYCLDVMIHYEGVFYGGNVPEINNKLRPHVILAMVKLWEKFEEVPAVLSSGITFDACCAALLNSIKTGLKIDVYLLTRDPKPKIWGNLTLVQQTKAVSKTITFIEPYDNLVLRDTDHVRRSFMNDKKKKARVVKKPIGGKPVYSNRQRVSSGGKTKNFSQIIPSLKNLNIILDIIVENATTITELEKFSLTSILSKN